jgi:hypothetical protein
MPFARVTQWRRVIVSLELDEYLKLEFGLVFKN